MKSSHLYFEMNAFFICYKSWPVRPSIDPLGLLFVLSSLVFAVILGFVRTLVFSLFITAIFPLTPLLLARGVLHPGYLLHPHHSAVSVIRILANAN